MMEPFKTTEEEPKMLDPVVLPLPLALAFMVALAVFLYAVDRFLHTDAPSLWAVAPAKAPGRHRLGLVAEPYRYDWAAATAERLTRDYAALVAAQPAFIAPSWHQPLTEFEQRIGVLEPDTREMAAIR